MLVTQWLNERFNEKWTRLERLVQLLALNSNDMNITQVNIIEPCLTNPMGRKGLSLEEALELNFFRGAIESLLWLEPGTKPFVVKHVQDACMVFGQK